MKHRRLPPLLLAIVVAGCVTVGLGAASGSAADTTWTETTGSVAHTWTDSLDAGGTEGQELTSNQSVQIACRLEGFRVADGNTWWYQIASAPWNNQFYVSADAFYNNGQTSGSLHGTPFYDPAVAICGSEPTGPTINPVVTLSQGPLAARGYRYAISLSGYSPDSSIPVTCYDSLSPSGFFTFDLTTSSSGAASTEDQCYSNDGPDHWVIAGGDSSNHVTWDSAPETNPATTPSSGGEPTSSVAPPTSGSLTTTSPSCPAPSGTPVSSAGWVWYSLYNHYMWGNGSPVSLAWSFLSARPDFTSWAKQLPADGSQHVFSASTSDTDLYLSLRSFTVSHEASGCYEVQDTYDFNPTDLRNFLLGGSFSWAKALTDYLTLPEWMYQLSGARIFSIRAEGSL